MEQQVRVGVLEWICGGGLQAVAPEMIPLSLRREGMAMLGAAAADLAGCGHEVLVSLDERLVGSDDQRNCESRFQVFSDVELLESLPGSWWEIAKAADAVLIVAPELSMILPTVISKLSPVAKRLLNCSGEFLHAGCDKWQCAMKWQVAGVNHPATRLASGVDRSWMIAHRASSERWVMKPRDGAGGEGIQVFNDSDLIDEVARLTGQGRGAEAIVQPYLQGKAFSCSAIVDAAGRPHWLPLVTQELSIATTIGYRGGEVLNVDFSTEWLEHAFSSLGSGAFGWVGFDLLRSEDADEWYAIEVNPRLTTSFVGLNRSIGGGLAGAMLNPSGPREILTDRKWEAVKFSCVEE